ncbi:hypothetical protein [Lentzea sp. NPDC059081]|uniref:hypothetical protein n=1 Tax=Lentzea sp. NPDC059081 TaxID=3346719 RepID=UPI0036C82DAB
MPTEAEQVWAWVRQPLLDFRNSCENEPDLDWPERVTRFLAALGLLSADQHPLTEWLVAHLTEVSGRGEDPVAHLAGTPEKQLAEVVAAQVMAMYPAVAQPPRSPEEVSADAVNLLGLPALTDLVTSRPDLVDGYDPAQVSAALAAVLATRLTGRHPAQDGLSTALAHFIEVRLHTDPGTGSEFYAVFEAHQELADQWTSHQVGLLADAIAGLLPVRQAVPVMPDLVAEVLRDVPGAAEFLTVQEINALILEALSESEA